MKQLIRARGALFDLDGTLVNSNTAVEEHWREFARWYEFDEDEFMENAHGMNHLTKIHSWLGDRSDDEIIDAIRRFERLEVEDAGSEVPIPGAIELLDSLKEGSYTIVTACWRELAEARAKVCGIELPSTAVTADQVTHGKPHPESYILAASRLGLDPSDCVVVEDSLSGVKAADAAGTQVVGVLTTTQRQRLEEAVPNITIVDTIADLEFELL